MTLRSKSHHHLPRTFTQDNDLRASRLSPFHRIGLQSTARQSGPSREQEVSAGAAGVGETRRVHPRKHRPWDVGKRTRGEGR